MPAYTWNLAGPMYRPATYDPGNLGLDYTDGVDARFPYPGLVCGPKRTDLDLSTAGGTAANTRAGVMMQRSSGGSEWFLYVLRGTRVTKVQVPSANAALSLASTQPTSSGTGDLSARGISAVSTKAPSGSAILSVGMDGTNAYHNLTTVAAENAADTWSAVNESSATWRILALDQDIMYGLGGQTINRNFLTSSVTADASAWKELAVFAHPNVKPTGFAISRDLLLWGTNIGLLLFNSRRNTFQPAFGLLPASDDNCRAMRYVPWLGVLVPLVSQLRLQDGEYGETVGPEAYGAPNVIQGTCMGLGYNARWAFMAYRNPANSTTYILAARPRHPGDWHGNPVSYYCIDSFSNASEWVDVLEDPGSIRTNQVLMVGNADDLGYYRIGLGENWTKDTTNYLYQDATNQTAYGNELHFDRPMNIERIVFEGANLASGRTLDAQVGYSTETGQEVTKSVVKQNRSGWYALDLPADVRMQKVHSFKPVVTLRTDTTASSPQLKHGRFVIVASEAK